MKWLALVLLLPWPAWADGLVATRLIRPTEVLRPGDVAPQRAATAPGVASDPAQVVGLEARVAIYPGRPVRLADLGPAAVIERNEAVVMIYRQGGLTIVSEGRALGRAALGQSVTVMNGNSRQSVQGRVISFGQVEVGPGALR
jgi:flagellar basal body P-ring formation protein FlgA